MADADLTIVILREVQADIRDVRDRLDSLEDKVEVSNERLSLVERAVTFMAAQVNVERRHHKKRDREKTDAIKDLQDRVSRLEDVVKP